MATWDVPAHWRGGGPRPVSGPRQAGVVRQDNDHVTFGKGSPHLCLGDLPARTEIRIMFEDLIPRLADIRLAGDVPRVCRACAPTTSTASRSFRSR